ncbi:MAG: bile acid:sodium symporter family protein [Alphaproteobacteria bacterium]
MTLADFIRLGLQLSIVLMVLGLGLNATLRDATYLVRNPNLLARSLLAMFIVMPLFVIAGGVGFELVHPIAIALIALAVSPVPPVLPTKAVRAGGDPSFAVGLLATAATLAIVFVPLAVGLLGWISAVDARISVGAVALVVVATVLAPLGIGLAVGHFVPAFADRMAKAISLAGTLLLIVCLVPVLISAWPAIEGLVGDGTIAAFAAFVVIGLVVGHLLGGPRPADRTVLALCTATRHPGIAIAIGVATFPEETAITPAVLLYLLVAIVFSLPYVAWSKRRSAGALASTGTAHP